MILTHKLNGVYGYRIGFNYVSSRYFVSIWGFVCMICAQKKKWLNKRCPYDNRRNWKITKTYQHAAWAMIEIIIVFFPPVFLLPKFCSVQKKNGTRKSRVKKSNYIFKWQIDHEIYTLLYSNEWRKIENSFHLFVVRLFLLILRRRFFPPL